MSLMEILQRYGNATAGRNQDTADVDFDQVAGEASPDVLGQGVGDAFRSDDTPPFEDMVSRMFGNSNPQERAGVLNQLLRSMGPAVISALGSGILGRISQQSRAEAPQVTPEQAAQLTPEQVREIAARAKENDPGVLDRIGGYYAQHPQLVKSLGSAALAIALAGVSNRMRKH
jgi:hypothetical protein